MRTDLTVDLLKRYNKALTINIAAEVQKYINQFYETTHFSPTKINIELHQVVGRAPIVVASVEVGIL